MSKSIERAINMLVAANMDITLNNVLPAYLRVAGFETMLPDALLAFEHALDKYPTRSHDASQTVFADGVDKISREYWSGKRAMVEDMRCKYCDACTSQLFNFRDTTKMQACGRHEGDEEAPERRVKSRKKKGRKSVKRDPEAEQFDPYAPSTSAGKR